MNVLALIFFVICAAALLAVPRKWAPVPLLVGCCYMTLGQGIELGPVSLPIFRMLLVVGMLRAVIKGEKVEDLGNSIDKLMAWFAGWIFFASFFHDGVLGSGPVYVIGQIVNLAAVYFLMRAWCRDLTEVTGVITIVAFMLAPIALEMASEKVLRVNQFSIFGGVPHDVAFREGKFRAQGPFRHPILAGTVGSVCLPLFVGIWRSNRLGSIVGIASALCMVLASASSGPIMSAMASVFALVMWRFRHLTKLARISAVVAYFGLQIVTGEPGYFVMKRIDISGGSTGYHRAKLIQSAFDHFDEWWLFGTDLTRHWMATGVSYTPYHTDITNYYLGFGVMAGFPAVLLMIAMLLMAFRWVGIVCARHIERDAPNAFMVWCLGAGMFAHAATSVSVAYFDQSAVFFWMNLAIISSIYSGEKQLDEAGREEEQAEEFPPGQDRGFPELTPKPIGNA